jgi:hypothetical protein
MSSLAAARQLQYLRQLNMKATAKQNAFSARPRPASLTTSNRGLTSQHVNNAPNMPFLPQSQVRRIFNRPRQMSPARRI